MIFKRTFFCLIIIPVILLSIPYWILTGGDLLGKAVEKFG